MECGFVNYMNHNLWLLRLFGIYPLYHTRGSTQISLGIMLYNIVLNVHLIVGCIRWLIQVSLFSLDNAMLGLCVVILVVLSILITVLLSRGCKKIGKIFCMIEDTETRLTLSGINCTYGRPPMFYTVFSLICLLLSSILKLFTLVESIIMYYLFHLDFIITLNLFAFTTLLYSLEVQFSSLSNQLLWMIRSNIHIKKKEQMMEGVIEIHEELCTICRELSKFYSVLLLLTITSSFIKFTVISYHLVWTIDELLICLNTLIILVSLLQGYTVCSSVAELSKKAKQFNTFLYQMMLDDRTNIISKNKKLRLHINMKREVVFSASGFFNLDYSLIHSFIAAGTTYICILVQFGRQDEYRPSPVPEMVNTTE